MPLENIGEVRAYLADTGGYEALLARHEVNPDDRSIWFEMVFAYWLIDSGVTPQYEVNVNPSTDKTVDFAAKFAERAFNMELVRIEHSQEVQAQMDSQDNIPDGIYGLLLHSDSENPFFKTAAQLIRLQEKILEKVEKFGNPVENTLSLVIVDCTNINVGILDEEDIRIAAYGQAAQPEFQEYWNGVELKGMFQPDFNFRHAERLRERLSAIVFLRKLEPGGLAHIFIASNPAKDVDDAVRQLPIFAHITSVKPA
jgi:hypothetical protein